MKASCLTCKRRHVKCDRRRPICTRCANAKTKVKCSYPVQFRQSGLSIAQPGHGLSYRFVDVSPGGNSSPAQDRCPPITSSPDHLSEQDALDGELGSPRVPDPQPGCAVPSPVSEPSPPSPLQYRSQSSNSQERSSETTCPCDVPTEKQPIRHLGPVLPTHSCQRIRITESEHGLFDFYLQHAGVWLDIVSSDRSFSQAVPVLALRKPLLYYACLAYAAHVMSLWGACDRARADYLHTEVITKLIPELDLESQLLPAEDLLATIVILRMSEQYSEPEQDAQCHLNGAYSLLTSTKFKWSPEDIDLKGTAFWTFVRQTLRICFLSEQECGFDLSIVNCSNMTSPAGDQVWTNRMTYLSAQVCNACWWSPFLNDASRDCLLDAIGKDIDSWRASVPETFKPWYYYRPSSDPFPTVRYFSSWHAIAWQQYYTARTMLAVYHRKPQVSVPRRDISKYLNSNILVPARLACGVVLSEPDVGCGINGAHLAYWCGQFFTGHEEQSKLLGWLERFMEITKWPNRTCITRLQTLWGIAPATLEGLGSPPLV